jgi:two-component system NarL family response regulator
MPEVDGIEAIKAIHNESPKARILVLTSRCREEDLVRVIRAGARGVLLKDATKSQLTDAIRTVNRGRLVLSEEMRQTLAKSSGPTRMTMREREVLSAMARGMSNQDIASDLHISKATVKSHAERVFAKLNVRDRTQAVVQGLKRGLVQVD